ncbi:pseudouridine synthase [Pedobacter mucosus]|uniref:pseudouridine synthase n=1 Tax=Pedobacter mucosus TaxID=2895286 RepID=UPI001EE3E384|nr:pseudouridine synthase [Pedobacter mucosus]UKT62927.1 pseudouridine synthase [Pedobacter mucosus]
MINKNNRNSRDDKSKTGSRSTEDRSSASGSDRRRSDDKDSKFKKSSDSKDNFRPRSSENKDFKSKSFSDRKDSRPRTGGRDFKSKDEESKGFKFGDREFKSKDTNSRSEDRNFKPREGGSRDYKPRTGDRDFKSREGGSRDYKPKEGGYRDFKAKDGDSRDSKSRTGDRDFKPREGGSRDYKPRTGGDRDFKPREGGSKDFKPRPGGDRDSKPREGGSRDFKPRTGERDFKSKDGGSRDYKPREGGSRDFKSRDGRSDDFKPSAGSSRDVKPREGADSRPFRKREESQPRDTEFNRPERTVIAQGRKTNEDKGLIRLNRYISNAGICSRRKADELIAAGVVTVNGEAVTELGLKVDPSKDLVRYNGELLKRERKVYVLLNKPKDYITTTDDPQERRTVMQLVDKASKERIYPVGRLDRNTTGLLLMTNDGDLADKLSHPKNGITKMYQIELDKSLSQGDLNKISFGLELEDGLIKPDSISYVAGGTKKEIGIQIHSGKNRIVRRIFEHLGYNVEKLDRVVYGNLTKKDLPRGRWRYLEEHELIQIKHLIK